MRLISFAAFSIMGLTACLAPAPQTSAPQAEAALPFNVPMDPGMISCSSLANPQALLVATQWALGQSRAALMAGQIAAAPTADAMSARLADYCRSNGSANIRTATRAVGA